jgi:hypothetical protein
MRIFKFVNICDHVIACTSFVRKSDNYFLDLLGEIYEHVKIPLQVVYSKREG